MPSKRELIAETLKIPRETICKDMVLTMTGQRELLIENYRGMIDYCDTQILIQGNHQKLSIIGTHLNIPYYTNDVMQIIGFITKIEYI